MELQNIIENLQGVMNLDFDERAGSFKKYRDILKSEISSNPSNIEAFCLMAMITCELREDTEKSIEILEQCYAQNQLNFTDEGFAIWATDMAYFLLEECGENCEERAEELLSQAISRNSNYASTYYAYGKFCFKKSNFEKASKLFHKAFELSPKKSYGYCKAVSLLAFSRQDEGISELESIYSYPFEDEQIDVKIALTLGRELAHSGNTYKAKRIAEILLNTDYREFDIEIDEMADFLYILGDYKTCIELYDKSRYWEEASWLNKYFYALKQLGHKSIADKKLQEITGKIEKDIHETKMNPTDWESDEDYQYHISSETKRLLEIKEGYSEVFIDSIKILPDTYYNMFYQCYYINCPRHYSV
ncbi:tetratricopeptide repeat family protein [Desulfosporosinus sp. OT]|uniref:tetratricopeptide repeat protein n=1 Tax=Desulfosporosinus sp. OT TaxID=913865 RepID=UPI000223A8D7|nr:tetratricopeptide repeat family protein [Desulfosporosinus sp. OT]EGW39791.1 tetratricopeptide repeat family protein [Desulfosporosinus sp. OT]